MAMGRDSLHCRYAVDVTGGETHALIKREVRRTTSLRDLFGVIERKISDENTMNEYLNYRAEKTSHWSLIKWQDIRECRGSEHSVSCRLCPLSNETGDDSGTRLQSWRSRRLGIRHRKR